MPSVLALLSATACEPGGYDIAIDNRCSVEIGWVHSDTLKRAKERLIDYDGDPFRVAPHSERVVSSSGSAGDADIYLTIVSGPARGIILPLPRVRDGDVAYSSILKGKDCAGDAG